MTLKGSHMKTFRRTIASTWAVFISLCFTLILIFSASASGPTCTTWMSPTGYTMILCITVPSDGDTISGMSTVTANVSNPGGGSPGIQWVQFTLDGNHLLRNYTPVSGDYTFQLPTDYYANGTHSLTVYALMRDGYTSTTNPTINLSFSNAQQHVNTNSFTPTSGSTPAPGQPLILAAAGDGASGEPASSAVTDRIASWSPNLFLYLGDVYEKGTYTEMMNWYGTNNFFGQFRAITDPVVGNHEYVGGVANGYLDYWDIGYPPSGTPTWYSFNAGGWHFIALDANTEQNQNPGSPQYSWLVNDLNNNTAACTLAYWHQPLFNTGAESAATNMQYVWSLLTQHSVDVVLNGHDHDYQRWKPLDANGIFDPENGITEFVVGASGHGTQTIVTIDARVDVALDNSPGAFGALRMQLNPGGMNYQYIHHTDGAILELRFTDLPQRWGRHYATECTREF